MCASTPLPTPTIDSANSSAGAPRVVPPAGERRYDAVVADAIKPYRRDADGAMLFDAIVSREGILEYRRADGSVRRELVTAQAIRDTAATLPRSVVTLDHPADGMVTPDNYQAHSVGDVDGES